MYNIDPVLYTNSVLPVNKRKPVHISWLIALNKGLYWLNGLLNDYIYGVQYPYYDGGVTYNYGDRVDGSPSNTNYIYESLVDSNTANPLTDSTKWLKVLPTSVGANDRRYFTANKMCFEYALNKYFRTTFRQPTGVDSYGYRSDIYIDNNEITTPNLFIGDDGTLSYTMGYTYEDRSSGYILDDTATYLPYQYTIYVPNTLLATYGEQSVRNIADKYNLAPLTYIVVGY